MPQKDSIQSKNSLIYRQKDYSFAVHIKQSNQHMDYHERIADRLLREHLDAFGAVLIEGPKWCGKTTTAARRAASILQMQDPDLRDGYIATAGTKPSLLLIGDTPRLIDEWQIAPVIWDAVRTTVDKRGGTGHFILTGSNSIDMQSVMHSGIGRIARLKMYPMSLWESRHSTGEISLCKLFDEPNLDIDGLRSTIDIEHLVFLSCVGGWPASLALTSDKSKLLIAQEYINGICQTEISTVDGMRRNAALTRLILKSYARNIGTLAKKSVIIEDVQTQMELGSSNTFDSYLLALNRLFVVEDVEAWSPSIRSKTAIRSSHKRCFTDPSIAVASLGLKPADLLTDMKTFGFIFEVLCIRDLRVYSQGLGGHLSYYHDRYGLEADAVLHLPNGRYALIEFKLGSREIEEGARHLLDIKHLVEVHIANNPQSPLRTPDLLIVITGGQMAYTRPDGVKIIPIGCLRD